MNNIKADSFLNVGDVLLGVNTEHENFLQIVIVIDISYSPSMFGGMNDITVKYKNGEKRTYKEYEIADMFKILKLEKIKYY